VRRRLVLVSLLLLVLCISRAPAKTDDETGRIRLVLFGEGWSLTPAIMTTDPKITALAIPAGSSTYAEYMARFMRIYMPRSYREWVEEVDMFILSDLVPWGFRGEHFAWMIRSIEEEGTGMLLSEMGWYGIIDWTTNAAEHWLETTVYEAFPCDMVIGEMNQECSYLLVTADGPFLELPGIEEVAFADEQGIHLPREGAITWAIYRKGREPAILSRPYGRGNTVANSMGLERFVQPCYEWKYYKDYFINHAYFSAGVPVPADLELVHRIREQLETFMDRRKFVMGTIDFIDRFNANTRPVEEMVDEIIKMKGKAVTLYLEQRYEEASETIGIIMERFVEIDAEAVRLRNQALLWVYVIEWLAVSATGLLSGVVVWALMVRRRLFREVGVTRDRGIERDEG